jgi:hypothetical protein
MTPLDLPDEAARLAPKEIGRLVSEDLARVLPGGPWSVTRDGVRAADDRQITDLTLQRSRASRTGQGVWFHPRLVVRDKLLEQWRQREQSPVGGDAAVLYNSLLINISRVNTVEVLTTSSPAVPPLSEGRIGYRDFVTELVDEVLPNREHLRSPITVAQLPDKWLWDVRPLVEWCVASGHSELCWALAERCVGTSPARTNPFKRGLSDGLAGRPVDTSNSLSMLGHVMARLSEHLEPAPPWTDG